MWQKLRAFRMVMVAIVGILGVAIADISNFNGFIAASKEFTEYLQREFGVPFGGVSGAVVLILTVVILVILLRKKLPLHRATTANKASIARDNIRRAYLH